MGDSGNGWDYFPKDVHGMPKRYKVGLYSFNEKEVKRNIETGRLRCT